jgi:hypothetical protein
MRKILMSLILFQFSIHVLADTPDLSSNTNIVTFPRITVDKKEVYTNTELLLSPNGSWEILKYTHETGQEHYLNLRGYWKTFQASEVLCKNFFEPPHLFEIELLIIQVDNKVMGFELSNIPLDNKSAIKFNGELSGTVTGRDVYIENSYENKIQKTYVGTINSENSTLSFNSDVVCGEGQGEHDLKLFLQN